MSHFYEFKSASRPDSPAHVTTAREDGSVLCSCTAYLHTGNCWHVREVKEYKHVKDTCSQDGCILCGEDE